MRLVTLLNQFDSKISVTEQSFDQLLKKKKVKCEITNFDFYCFFIFVYYNFENKHRYLVSNINQNAIIGERRVKANLYQLMEIPGWER